jgi:uncharacterized repeat protein (TIGR02543 family)
MRPMVLLASALFPSLLLISIQAGCSGDDNATPTPPLPDSGPISVPDATPGAQPVTVAIVGKGIVVSNDGVPQDGGVNGFVGDGGGSPVTDCPGTCTAPQGTSLYAYPQLGTYFADGGVNQPGYVFVGWSTGDAGAIINTNANFTVSPGTGSPLTATFVLASNGSDAAVPLNEDGGGPTMPFQEAGPGPSDDSGSEDSGSSDTGVASDSGGDSSDGG